MTKISPVNALLSGEANTPPNDGTQFRGQKDGIPTLQPSFPHPEGHPVGSSVLRSESLHNHQRSNGPQGLAHSQPRPNRPPLESEDRHNSCCDTPTRFGSPAISFPTAFLSGRDRPIQVGQSQGTFEEERHLLLLNGRLSS